MPLVRGMHMELLEECHPEVTRDSMPISLIIDELMKIVAELKIIKSRSITERIEMQG